ncbi:TetR/AcrR family transcriptional regulator [Ilumatobacter sp.]|uniref:TetR/AcrR family transcriptional regulator n=1 Tax=Ilumatobacter sp. TaxID=1967498 RepID=UPI003C540B2A
MTDKENHILDAVMAVLARDGIAATSMRAVARQADVALGLMNYYFDNKTSLIAAALRRLGDEDARIVVPDFGLDAEARLRFALRRATDTEFLTTDYLALRLQLWSLASVDPVFAEINHQAQTRYRDGLAVLIAAARPDVDPDEVRRRAADILIIQNGVWLTSILISDPDSIERSLARSEEIAFAK